MPVLEPLTTSAAKPAKSSSKRASTPDVRALPAEAAPRGLVPLPVYPYERRPDGVPLDIEECRTALWIGRGNVLTAARALKVEPARLRRFIKTSILLREEQIEAKTLLVERAEEIIGEALEDEALDTRIDAAKFVLERVGKDAGWSKNTGGVTINGPTGQIVISWAGDDATGTAPITIDHAPIGADE